MLYLFFGTRFVHHVHHIENLLWQTLEKEIQTITPIKNLLSPD